MSKHIQITNQEICCLATTCNSNSTPMFCDLDEQCEEEELNIVFVHVWEGTTKEANLQGLSSWNISHLFSDSCLWCKQNTTLVSCSPLSPQFKRFWEHFHQHLQTSSNRIQTSCQLAPHWCTPRAPRPTCGSKGHNIGTFRRESPSLFQRCVVKMGGISGSSWVWIQWI